MIKLRMVLSVCILLLMHTAMAQVKAIKGNIIESESGLPLSGVNVYLENTAKGVLSNDSGVYMLHNITPGKYTLKASLMGYYPYVKEIELSNQNLTINISLKENPNYLSEVVVTGTGTEHYIKDAPVQTEVITGKALQDYAGRDMEDILGGLSASFNFTASDMGSNMQLNGMKNDYILVLLDGRRMSAGVGGQNDLNRINLSEIERIEIVKGAVSTLYGSDAIGGVINFITKKHAKSIVYNSTTRVGEHEDLSRNENLSLSNGRVTSVTGLSVKHTHGWRNTTEEWHGKNLVTNSVTKTVNRSSNFTLSERLNYDLTKSLNLYADASFYRKWTKRPMGEPNWRLNDLYYQNQTYGLGAKYKLGLNHYLVYDSSFDRFDYYYDYNSREYTDYYDKEGNPIVFMEGDRILQSSERRFINALKGVFKINEHNTLSIGMEHIWEKLIAPFRLSNNRAVAYNLSAYVQNEFFITDRFNITAGIRYGKHRDFRNTFTPKLSLMYKITDDLTLRANYSQGFKAPTMKELYYHYYATIMSKYKAYYGNTNLKAQQSNYYSLSADYQKKWAKLSVTLYHNALRNMISLQSTETSYEDKQLLVEETMVYVNLAKARTYGVDLSGDFTLPFNLKLGLGYSLLHAKAQRTDDEKADDYMKWVNMNATSRHSGNIKLSWFEEWSGYRLGMSLTGRLQSKRYYTSHGQAKAYQVWRLNTTHGLVNTKGVKLDLHIGIDNIFDFVDREPFGHNRATTSPGRNYYASLILKFQGKKS